jgi:hypothetical protein
MTYQYSIIALYFTIYTYEVMGLYISLLYLVYMGSIYLKRDNYSLSFNTPTLMACTQFPVVFCGKKKQGTSTSPDTIELYFLSI